MWRRRSLVRGGGRAGCAGGGVLARSTGQFVRSRRYGELSTCGHHPRMTVLSIEDFLHALHHLRDSSSQLLHVLTRAQVFLSMDLATSRLLLSMTLPIRNDKGQPNGTSPTPPSPGTQHGSLTARPQPAPARHSSRAKHH